MLVRTVGARSPTHEIMKNCFELNPKMIFTCVGGTTATSALPDAPPRCFGVVPDVWPGCFGVDDDCGGENAPEGRAIWSDIHKKLLIYTGSQM